MIVVTTPTGQVGGTLVRLLFERGADVRVIARDATRLPAEVRDRAEVVEGSHADAAVLDEALPGADALFWLVPPELGDRSPVEHYERFAEAGAAAAIRHGVGHVVAVSSAGHGWPKPAGMLSAAFALDAVFERTPVAYRALALPSYMENLLGQLSSLSEQGRFFMTNTADAPLPLIATRDIAEAAADLLTDLAWSGHERLAVFGPDRLTPDGMAEVIGAELGRPVAYQQLSMDDLAGMFRAGGAPEPTITGMTEMFTAANEGIYTADWARATRTRTDFRSWCREVLVPALRAAA